MQEMNLIEYLEQYGKGDKTWRELAEQFGYGNKKIAEGIWRRHQEGKALGKTYTPLPRNLEGRADKLSQREEYQKAETANYIAELEDQILQYEEDIKKGSANLTAQFKEEIRNLEDLVEKTNIDTSVWEITKYIQNYWGQKDNGCYQVKAWLSRKTIDPIEKLQEFFQNYTSTYQPIRRDQILLNNKFSSKVSVLISLTDPHIDKTESIPTTIDEKCAQYLEVLERLLYKSYHSHNIDEIVYVLGNDFFTSDTYWNTTTATTPQAVTNEFDSAYEKGFELTIKAINLLRQFCNKLHVVYVPGNHDRTKSFYLVHALSVFFSGDKNIIFDRSAENTKAYEYGNTGIFFHHGDTPLNSLPLYMASKYREIWGRVKYSEVCLGDKHHKKEWKYSLNNTEIDGTRMFICPALTAPDKWHKDKRYDNAIQAGVCRVYDFNLGKVAEFEERV